MASFHLPVDQINFSECYRTTNSHVFETDDSFSSVIDPNTDFSKSKVSSKNADDIVNTAEWQDMETMSSHLSSSPSASVNGSTVPEKGSSRNPAVLDNATQLFSYEGVDGVYPSIPLPVAHYVNQQNPDLCAKVADVLRKSGIPEEHQLPSKWHSDLRPSPLRSLANTSDALALQHSVIGSSKVKPVSAEMVAKVVEGTKIKLNSNDLTAVPKTCSQITLSSTESDHGHFLKREVNGVLYSEILRYPPESITATIEKRSWIGPSKLSDISSSSSSSSPARATTNKKSEKQRRNSQSSTASSVGSKHGQQKSQHLPTTHYSRKVSDEVFSKLEKERSGLDASIYGTEKKDLGSSMSDVYDLESSFSETFETESAFSGISGIEEEMSQVKRLLIDVSEENATQQYAMYKNMAATHSTQTETCSDTIPESTRLKDQATETESLDHFKILREKVALEGELETLKNELDSVIRNSGHSQAVTVSLEAQISTLKTMQERIKLEKESMALEIEKVEREKQQWKNVIDEYQSVIDTKNSEIKSLKEDIAATETQNEKLKITYQELQVDMDTKDGAVQGLKRKIAELHVELQTMLQGKIQLQNDIKSIEAEKATLQKSKEWYQEQLHLVQDNRNKLHQDFISHQAAHTTSLGTAERLRVENSHLRQQVADVQQKAVKEKEIIMKHLENIEADMLDREAIFQQMKQDEGSAEEAISEKMRKMEEEQTKLTNLSFKVSDLEHQLGNANKMLLDKEKSMKILEYDRVELTKRVTLLQKSLNDQVLLGQQLEQQKTDLGNKVKYMELELKSSENQISELKSEKMAIEVALAAANGEKRSINDALKVVKENLNKVESKFNLMRTELLNKASQSEHLLKEKQRLEDSLQQIEEQLFQQKRAIKLQKSVDYNNQSAVNNEHHHKNEELDGILNILKEDLKQNEIQRFKLIEENESIKQNLENIKEKMKESEQENEALRKQVKSRDKYSASIKSRKNSDCLKFENCSHIDHIESMLQASEQHYKEKQRVYESNIKVLTRKLKEVLREGKKREKELADLRDQTNQNLPQQQSLKKTTVSVQTEMIENIEGNSLTDMEKMVPKYEETIQDLNKELSQAVLKYEEQKLQLEESRSIILDLEKEKGHFKGFQESNNNLKQRILELEGVLVKKETDVSELGQQTQGLRVKHQEDEVKAQDHLKSLEQDLANEKALIKELRHQVFQEKRESSHLKRHVANLKNGLNQSSQLADLRQQDIARLKGELELKHQAELKHRSEMESQHTECRRLNSEMKQIQKELEESQARDPALAQQLKTLSWHLKEKNQELNSMKEHLQLLEERHLMEVSTLQKQIQNTQLEMEELRAELISTRKEKFNLQAKVAELRGALKSSVDLNKQLRRDLSERDDDRHSVSSLPLPASPAPYDEKFINSLLQQSLILPESRPLSNLQACLNALKQEMSVLQQQLQDHGAV